RREARQEGGRNHDAQRPGVGGFRVQARVAADARLALVGRTVEPGREHRAGRNARRNAKRRGGGNGTGRRARIAAAVGRCAGGRGEQFRHVRRANRTLEAAAEAQVVNRLPLDAEVVGVRIAGQVVVIVTIRGVELQALHERRVLDERYLELEEAFADVEAAADPRYRLETDEIAGLEVVIGGGVRL